MPLLGATKIRPRFEERCNGAAVEPASARLETARRSRLVAALATALVDAGKPTTMTAKTAPLTAAAAPLRPGADRHRRRLAVRQHRRAHQRHRLQSLRAHDPRRRVRASARRGAAAGGKRRADHRRQHGRGDARFEGGDGALSEPDGRRARDRARAGDDRLVEVVGHRSRAAMHPGQGHRQLDLDEGRRGRVPPPGDAGAPLRRGRGRHGLRRKRPGRHLRAQDRDLRAGLQDPGR